MQITEQRKKRLIDLYFNQHKSYAEIAQLEHISPRDIHAIIKEEETRRQKYKDHQQSAKANKLFSEDKTTVEVAIELDLPASTVCKLHREYWKLRGLDKLNIIYKETNGKIWIVLKLYKELIKKKGMNIEQVASAVDTDINKLPYMENLYRQAKDEAEKMQHTIQRLANDVAALEHKISILDKIAFSSELECRRKHQEIQELIAQKDLLEKLIANILNGEGHSKLKQIVKDSVKAILADNKQVISVSFAALLQTLKSDPEMIKVIYNIPNASDGEQHKDNNNNITKYLESNKDNILNLTENHYKNLVEALTNNAISSAVPSSNFTLPLLSSSSSSTFQSPSDPTDTYTIEEPGSYHNSKGDIAD